LTGRTLEQPLRRSYPTSITVEAEPGQGGQQSKRVGERRQPLAALATSNRNFGEDRLAKAILAADRAGHAGFRIPADATGRDRKGRIPGPAGGQSSPAVIVRDPRTVQLAVSDPGELGSLRTRLTLVPAAEVVQVAGMPGPGEQGALDVLTVIAGSSGLVAAVRTLPEFLRSRRSGLWVTATVDGKQMTVVATNVDEVTPVLERLLDD
jgi:hypothetical protein